MLQEIIQRVLEELTSSFKQVLEGYTNRFLRRLLRILVLGGIGISFLAAGSIFILLGIITYLSQFMFSGLAWGLVGLITVLIGGLLLLLIRR
jgi:hypothetical protein